LSTATTERAAAKRYDHTEGSVLRSIFHMGLPSMIGFAATNVYDIVDMFWVAKLGAESVAAVTVFFSFYWVISSANQIAGSGSLAVISRRYGEKNAGQTEAAIKEALLLKWALALICGLVGYAFLRPVLSLLGATGTVHELAARYGAVQLLGLGFSFASFTIYTALRGVGDPRKAMVLMLSGVGINIILDPLLIFGWGPFPRLGVTGAALASIIGFGATFFAGLVIFYGGWTAVRLRLRGSVPVRLARMGQMLNIGFPSGISSVSFSLARAVVMSMIAAFGAEVIAVYGMAQRVTALGIMVVVGMGLGLSALVGQNLGAGKPERARQTADAATLFCGLALTVFAAATILFARPIARAFFDAPALIEQGVVILRIFSLNLPFVGFMISMEMAITGAGQTRWPMFFSILASWILQVPLILLVTRALHLGPTAVWWSMVAAEVIALGLFFIYYRRYRWLQTKV